MISVAQEHALLAVALVGVCCGVVAPFVVNRGMAFAVHGISELAFVGATASLLLGGTALAGAAVGSLVVAVILGILGVRERERDSSIGVLLAFGLGLGVLLLSFYHGPTAATDILFGNIFGVTIRQLSLLGALAIAVTLGVGVIHRPLQFASVDPEVAEARGVPVRNLGIVFLLLLALAITAVTQVVGTMLVLCLAITPAAAAVRLSSSPAAVMILSMSFALIASVGGVLIATLFPAVTPSVFVTFISFGIYLLCRLV